MNNEQLARKYFSVFGNNPVSIDEWDILVQQMRVPLQEENDKLKLFVEDAKKEGIRQCINLLRTLQHTPNHRSQWNHSADVNFAPVELSDYLLKLLRDE